MADDTKFPDDVARAAAALADLRPMRRGALGTRFMKCSKPGCRCGEDPSARHGPYHTLTRATAGTTRSRYLSSEEAAVAEKQVEAARQFRERVEAAWEACERWADSMLDALQGETADGGEKGGSRHSSRRRS